MFLCGEIISQTPLMYLMHRLYQIDENLTYEEELVAIVDKQVKSLRSKEIVSMKVLWRNHTTEEATWELEKEMQDKYPLFFKSTCIHLL